MGVPALFRWLSKKYPKIVGSVIEEEPFTVADEAGEKTEIPVDTTTPNPNGTEFDCLYLDMNGIVHPCTHPEGKPAPETEDEMMVEIFKYTDRVVNMIRPRKLLFLAIDGVAPRAKMNQQRSRRFRAVQEAKEKQEELAEAVKLFEAMGHPVSEETKNKKSWDSNAITPGTPFMEHLATSLKYWIASKISTDPGWKNMQVVLSDASVPGEGEHKIMDYIRRQRVNPDHDPNTQHVIYGLDADLIMLALATHEPHFRVLREDVFADDAKNKNACRICGQEGHYAAQCTGAKKIKADDHDIKSNPVPAEKKPFIFLNVEILREYLAVELNVPNTPFRFDLERAIDDWVFLIFFVGNDFLPHMPSLDIREGAIDTLLRIWKRELPRMGGYLTDNGQVRLESVQIVLESLARSENDIFRRRRETEERQDSNAKRRRLQDESNASVTQVVDPGFVAVAPAANYAPPPIHPSLPPRPSFDIVAVKPPPSVATPMAATQTAIQAIAGTDHDVVANRGVIRTANLSAAERLKAEMANLIPLGRNAPKQVHPPKPAPAPRVPDVTVPVQEVRTADDETEQKEPAAVHAEALQKQSYSEGDVEVPTVPYGNTTADMLAQEPSVAEVDVHSDLNVVINPAVNGLTPIEAADNEADRAFDVATNGHAAPDMDVDSDADAELIDGTLVDEAQIAVDEGPLPDDAPADDHDTTVTAPDIYEEENRDGDHGETRGIKRKANVLDEEEELLDVEPLADDDDESPNEPEPFKMRKNADGTVEQEDTVKLWEPGYRERYYQQKFGRDLSDREFLAAITKSYIEGLAWVLHYYYQGTPSWHWFYPYHFAPFAQDFEDLRSMTIKFDMGQPFKPFEQLMGVFPAASRSHIPSPFHELMLQQTSPIIDFYPETFQIDMNGKKMAWQGVALLPFIDQARLLQAMSKHYPDLSEDEVRRNRWGNNVLYVSDQHRLYDFLCTLYAKRKSKDPLPLDTRLSGGIAGSVLPDPECIPGSTYFSPLTSQGLADIEDNHSLSVLYFYPKQVQPHRSVLLKGVRMSSSALTEQDKEWVRSGGGSRGRGRGGHLRDNNPNAFRGDRDSGWGGGSGGTYGPSGYREGGYPRDGYGREARGTGPPGRTSYPDRGRPLRDDHSPYTGYGRGQSGPSRGSYGYPATYGAPAPPSYGGYSGNAAYGSYSNTAYGSRSTNGVGGSYGPYGGGHPGQTSNPYGGRGGASAYDGHAYGGRGGYGSSVRGPSGPSGTGPLTRGAPRGRARARGGY